MGILADIRMDDETMSGLVVGPFVVAAGAFFFAAIVLAGLRLSRKLRCEYKCDHDRERG